MDRCAKRRKFCVHAAPAPTPPRGSVRALLADSAQRAQLALFRQAQSALQRADARPRAALRAPQRVAKLDLLALAPFLSATQLRRLPAVARRAPSSLTCRPELARDCAVPPHARALDLRGLRADAAKLLDALGAEAAGVRALQLRSLATPCARRVEQLFPRLCSADFGASALPLHALAGAAWLRKAKPAASFFGGDFASLALCAGGGELRFETVCLALRAPLPAAAAATHWKIHARELEIELRDAPLDTRALPRLAAAGVESLSLKGRCSLAQFGAALDALRAENVKRFQLLAPLDESLRVLFDAAERPRWPALECALLQSSAQPVALLERAVLAHSALQFVQCGAVLGDAPLADAPLGDARAQRRVALACSSFGSNAPMAPLATALLARAPPRKLRSFAERRAPT